MTSKHKLKKRVKKLKQQIAELQDTTIGTLWFVANLVKVYDGNMDLIQKTFERVVEKINALEDIVKPVSEEDKVIEETEQPDAEE